MTGITVTQRDGNLLACKTAQAEESDRLRHEAQLLERLQHPGIVQFVDFVEGATVELYLGFVGPDSWATQPPSTSSETIEALASAASTVADLHNLGTVHGAIRPEHVLVAPDKRPILCGLADATAATESGCAQDLAGLAVLIDYLASTCDAKESRQLSALARRAELGSVTASDLTAELNRMHGGTPKLATRLRQTPTSAPPKRILALGAVVVVVGAVVGWAALKPSATSDTSVANPVPLASTAGSNSVPSTTTPTTSTAPTANTAPAASTPPTTSTAATANTAPTASTAPIATVDTTADEDRLVITHNGRRYGVGQTGDVAILGDWSCDGNPTLALLQPSTGLIAMFATWPAPSEQLEATYVTVINGATGLRNDPSGGCDHLRVIHQTGSTLINPDSL